MAVLVGTYYLQRTSAVAALCSCGVPGVPPGDVVIIGGGIVGLNAAKVAVGFGGRVVVLDTNLDRLRHLDDIFHGERHHAGEQRAQPARGAAARRRRDRRRADPRLRGAQAGDPRTCSR